MEKGKLKKVIFSIILLISLIGLVFSDLLTDYSLKFLQKVSALGFANLAIIGVLKGVLAIMSSIEIGVGIGMNIGGILKGLTDVVDRAFNFFMISNALIVLQIFLLKISKFIIVKILIVAASILIFIKPIKRIGFSILLILLLINPGFSLYVSLTKTIYEYTIPDTGNEIKERFVDIKDNFQKIIEAEEGFFSKAKNAPKAIFGVVSKSLSSLIDILLIYFVSSLVLFLFFPGIFYYCMYLLVKRLIRTFEGQLR